MFRYSSLMRCKIPFILLLMASYLSAQENYRVRKIVFMGNETITSSQLLTKMTLQPKNGLKRLRDKSKGVSFSHELLQNDIDELLYLYHREGFIRADVQLGDLVVDDEKESVEIVLHIAEGPPTLVHNIYFNTKSDSFREELSQATDKALIAFKLQAGSRFRDDDFKTDLAQLKNILMNAGFVYAAIDYRLDISHEKNLTDIHYIIDSGRICYFGEIGISGNEHVSDRIIRKQISFQKGDVFSRWDIDKSQEQIYSLNVFQIVSLQAHLESKKVSIPMSVKIKEAPRFTNKFGVGWGQEDRFRASMDTQWLRFFGGARRLNLVLKHSALDPYHINLRFTQPAFIHPNISLGLNPFIRRQDEPGYNIERRGLDVYLQRQIKRILTTGITYTFEKVNLDTTSIGDAESQPDVTDLYNKSSVTLGIAQNNTDDIFSPNKGYNNGLTFKFSGIGPSTYDYTKWMIDLRHYMTIPRGVLAVRLKLGEINSMDAGGFIPVEDRFYSGGANSIRGWARHELGPKDADDKPIGGNAILEGSLEFRIPIIGSFNSAVFWDFGNVWQENFGDIVGEINHAVGCGIRFRTPIGPLRFDLAAPVLNDEKHIRWHLTLGEAF
jgi:outer membrane protein insertion porin family